MYNRYAKIIAIILAVVLVFAILASSLSFVFAKSENNTVVIYYTSNMNGNINSIKNGNKLTGIGFDILKSVKDKTQNSVLVDVGNTITGSVFSKSNKGLDVISIMNKAGYDGISLGCNDFSYGVDAIIAQTKAANFPVVSANTLYKENILLDKINDNNGCHFIKIVNGQKIGFFGMIDDKTLNASIKSETECVSFKNKIQTAKEQVAALKSEGADVIIALAYLGIDKDGNEVSNEIAKNVSGIDIIIDGNYNIRENTTIEDTVLIKCGSDSAGLGKIEIKFKNDKLEINPQSLMIDEIEKSFGQDSSILDLYNEIYSKLSPKPEAVVGKISHTLYAQTHNGKKIAELSETNFGDFLGDTMCLSGKSLAQGTSYSNFPIVAVLRADSIQSKISEGYITVEDINKSFPYDNVLTLQIITPDILYRLMEYSVSKLQLSGDQEKIITGGSSAFSQISGFQMKIDLLGQPSDEENSITGNRVREISLLNNDGTDGQLLDRNDRSTQVILACDDHFVNEYPIIKDIEIKQSGEHIADIFSSHVNKLTFEKGEAFSYNSLKPRIDIINKLDFFKEYDADVYLSMDGTKLISKTVSVKVDNNDSSEIKTDEFGKFSLNKFTPGRHTINVYYMGMEADSIIDDTIGIKTIDINFSDNSKKNITSTIDIINKIPDNVTRSEETLIKFARLSYNELGNQEKEKVTNYNSLVVSENALKKLLEESGSSKTDANDIKISTILIWIVLCTLVISAVSISFVLYNKSKRAK